MGLFAKNLEALSHVDKQLELLLNQVKSNEIFEVYLADGNEPIDANILDHRDKTTLYKERASLDIGLKLKEFEKFDNYPLLYCFGIGNGFFYKELLKNQKHQRIMIIEPELELIYIALNLVDFSQEIIDERIAIKLSTTVDKTYFINEFNDRSKFFLKVYDFHLYSSFYDKYKQEIDRVNKDIVEAYKYSIYIIGNSAKDSLIGLEFSLKNIPQMLAAPTLKQFLDVANKTKYAIIVSTGPSLAKQLPLLKEVQDYVSIMCIDASFPILAKEGIKPDVVFSIERVELTGKFYKDTPKEFHKDVLFSVATVCHDETLNNIHGQKCFFMRGDSYNVYFGLDEWGYLGGGLSAANYAFDFAAKAGSENIVLIGQDLAYGKDGSSHSKNHVFGEDEVKSEKIAGYVEAYGGDGEVATTKVWKSFLNSFKIQVKLAIAKCINSTEGGARISGALEIPFKEVCDTLVDKTHKKEKIKLDIPSKESIKEHLDKFKCKREEAVKIGKSMSKNANKVFNEFSQYLNEIKDFDHEDIETKVSMKKLDKMISKISEIKLRYNDAKFADMYATLLLAYVINHEFDVAQVYVMRDNTELAKKLKKIEWIRVHSEWLYRLYTNIDAIVLLLEDSLDS